MFKTKNKISLFLGSRFKCIHWFWRKISLCMWSR